MAVERPAYPAVLRKVPDGDYTLSFPDLPGCMVTHSTVEATLFAAREALAGHLDGLVELRRRPPRPSNLYDIERHPEHGEGLPLMITPWPGGEADDPSPIELQLTARTLRTLDEIGANEHKTRGQIIDSMVAELLATDDN